jgi:hypothetical protein
MWSASGDERGKLKWGSYNKSQKAAVHWMSNCRPHTEDKDEEHPINKALPTENFSFAFRVR